LATKGKKDIVDNASDDYATEEREGQVPARKNNGGNQPYYLLPATLYTLLYARP
jgi:hypothetical protein